LQLLHLIVPPFYSSLFHFWASSRFGGGIWSLLRESTVANQSSHENHGKAETSRVGSAEGGLIPENRWIWAEIIASTL